MPQHNCQSNLQVINCAYCITGALSELHVQLSWVKILGPICIDCVFKDVRKQSTEGEVTAFLEQLIFGKLNEFYLFLEIGVGRKQIYT